MKEESEEAGLKSILKIKIMASGPISSWQMGREEWKLTDFIFLGAKITVDGDFSHKIRRCLLLGREAMPSQPKQCIKKQTHHFANKGPLQAKP